MKSELELCIKAEHVNLLNENLFWLLKDISNKDLSTLAKAAFELLKWTIFEEPHRKNAVAVIHKSANDSNWRTRSATLTYLRSFMFR